MNGTRRRRRRPPSTLADRLERELSRFRSNSDITRVNHLAAGESTRGRPVDAGVPRDRAPLFDLTGGAFDISIGTGLPSLELDADDFLVRATTDGVQVDLGGIGKGYAVDLMAELLEEWGLQRALVHGGFSSVLALEAPAGRDGWPLTLSDPAAPSRVLARLSVRQTALGASGVRKGDHIVDPRTRRARPRAARGLGRGAAAGDGRGPGACRRGAEPARRRRGRRVDDRLHAAERRGDRGPVRAQSRAGGLGPAATAKPRRCSPSPAVRGPELSSFGGARPERTLGALRGLRVRPCDSGGILSAGPTAPRT